MRAKKESAPALSQQEQIDQLRHRLFICSICGILQGIAILVIAIRLVAVTCMISNVIQNLSSVLSILDSLQHLLI